MGSLSSKPNSPGNTPPQNTRDNNTTTEEQEEEGCCRAYFRYRQECYMYLCGSCQDKCNNTPLGNFLCPPDDFGEKFPKYAFYANFYYFLRPLVYRTFLIVSAIALVTSVPHVGRQLVAQVIAVMLILALPLFPNRSCMNSCVYYTLVVTYLVAAHYAVCVNWMPKQSDYLMFSYLIGYVWYIILVKLCFLEFLRDFEVWTVQTFGNADVYFSRTERKDLRVWAEETFGKADIFFPQGTYIKYVSVGNKPEDHLSIPMNTPEAVEDVKKMESEMKEQANYHQHVCSTCSVFCATGMFVIYLIIFALSCPLPGVVNLFPFVSVDVGSISDDDFTGYDDAISPFTQVQSTSFTEYTFMDYFEEYVLPVLALTVLLAYFSYIGLKQCNKRGNKSYTLRTSQSLADVEMPYYEAIPTSSARY